MKNSLIFSPFMYERCKEDTLFFHPRNEFSQLQLNAAKVLRGFLISDLILWELGI